MTQKVLLFSLGGGSAAGEWEGPRSRPATPAKRSRWGVIRMPFKARSRESTARHGRVAGTKTISSRRESGISNPLSPTVFRKKPFGQNVEWLVSKRGASNIEKLTSAGHYQCVVV